MTAPKPIKRIKIVSVAPEDFKKAWLAIAAFQAGRLPGVDTAGGRIDPHSLLGALAAVAYVTKDPDQNRQISLRIWALQRLIQTKSLERFIKRTAKGQPLIPEVLLDVAAVVPCSPSGFNKKRFINGIKTKLKPKKKTKRATPIR